MKEIVEELRKINENFGIMVEVVKKTAANKI